MFLLFVLAGGGGGHPAPAIYNFSMGLDIFVVLGQKSRLAERFRLFSCKGNGPLRLNKQHPAARLRSTLQTKQKHQFEQASEMGESVLERSLDHCRVPSLARVPEGVLRNPKPQTPNPKPQTLNRDPKR